MRATRFAVVCGVVSSLLAACGSGAPEAEPAGAMALAVAPGPAGIYDDALLSGWADWSWGSTRNFAATSPVASGSRSLSVTYQAWGGLYLHRTSGSVPGMATLELYANGGSSAGNKILVQAVQGTSLLPGVGLAPYCSGGTIPANAWTRCAVPLSALLPAGVGLDGIVLQEGSGASRPAMTFDAIRLLPAPPPAPASVPIYTDALASGWADWSWGSTRNFSNPSPVASGAGSIAVTFQAWGALYLHRSASSVSGATSLELSVHGGSTAGLSISVRAVQGTTLLAPVALASYCTGGAIPAGAWTRCKVPLAALAPAGSALDGIVLQERNGTAHPAMYVDDVGLTGSSSTPPPVLPAAPTGLAATVSSGAVALAWSAVSGATGYDVWRASASAGPFAKLTSSPQPATTFRDASVAAGTTYWYRVTAVSAAGSGPASTAVSAAVPAAPPTVTVAISPPSATVDACGSARFAATVSGATDGSVAWSVQEGAAGGTIDASGSYNAPAAGGTYHVVAQSKASPSASATVPVVVQERILSIAVTPGSTTVATGGTQQFTATVTTTCGTFTASAQ
jgi:hypothetical protein